MTATACPRILIVDDCDIVRVTISEFLEEVGYTITSIADPIQALDLLKFREFDLLITDVQMPGMNGLQLATAARDIPRPTQLPVIFITGYSNEPELGKAVQQPNTALLTKPLKFATLLERIVQLTAHSSCTSTPSD